MRLPLTILPTPLIPVLQRILRQILIVSLNYIFKIALSNVYDFL